MWGSDDGGGDCDGEGEAGLAGGRQREQGRGAYGLRVGRRAPRGAGKSEAGLAGGRQREQGEGRLRSAGGEEGGGPGGQK